jgi:hypothetical protein
MNALTAILEGQSQPRRGMSDSMGRSVISARPMGYPEADADGRLKRVTIDR